MKRYVILLITLVTLTQLCHSTDLFGIDITKNRQQTLASLENKGFEKAVVTDADGNLMPNETDKSSQYIGSLLDRLVTVDVLYGDDPATIKMIKLSFRYFNDGAEMQSRRQTALENIESTLGSPTFHFSKTAATGDDTDIMLKRFGTLDKVPMTYDLWILSDSFVELAATPDNTEFYATYLFGN